ncbi:hypothetical protein PILCRDRAFT_811420 [Piloderma croceum F 1598]|uniref:Uncharacterized protein n=1 Tax=Piloderma croceum (strain F 1598) TaxID=765440 RepID=A0A0C3GGZ9_PILCF|nr:hypothetical protein PILCRDRAFT_811420 [Piloderma croceum F 1598]
MTSFFPTSPVSPNAFSAFAQSPREAHATCEDLRHVLRGRAPVGRRLTPTHTPSPMSRHSPRDLYTHHDRRDVLRPSNGQTYTKKAGRKSRLRKILGGM